MEIVSQTLYLEINKSDYKFVVGQSDGQNNFKINYKLDVPLNRISDLENNFNLIKENIYLIEKKLNFTINEVVLIIDNFDLSFVNVTGFKKLNGSQVLRENITYIINTLKSCIDQIESKKTVLHIFNSQYYLDNKKIENLPIGLFGDLYTHELSFALINTNDYKNLTTIFEECNLKIKKILIKSFIKGANTSDNNKNIDTFFQIKIGRNTSRIFYFENNALKYIQELKFGINIVINDISKITFLKKDTVENILNKIELKEGILDSELIEKEFFNVESYRKIKKKLIYEIALARIQEISEILLSKNINLKHFNKISKIIFLEFDHGLKLQSLKEIYKSIFSFNRSFNLIFLENLTTDSLFSTANKLVHFGWKKEAIPITQFKKSLIARFFDTIFG